MYRCGAVLLCWLCSALADASHADHLQFRALLRIHTDRRVLLRALHVPINVSFTVIFWWMNHFLQAILNFVTHAKLHCAARTQTRGRSLIYHWCTFIVSAVFSFHMGELGFYYFFFCSMRTYCLWWSSCREQHFEIVSGRLGGSSSVC